jgi:hypothetical protein
MSPQLLALLKKMGTDDLADLGASLVPALVEELNSLLPAGDQAIAELIEQTIEPGLQAALANLIAKVQL